MTQLRIIESLAQVPASDWDRLHGSDNPFVSHAFLSGLERHGCLLREYGWTPRHAALYEGDALVAAAPGYLKHNSHGEFVFDHAWAQAYARHGLHYYPKWLLAVPYTPATGPRLLARDEAKRRLLLKAVRENARDSGLSSLHANFLPETELAAFDQDADANGTSATWLARGDVQFHWRNDVGWRDFDDFLGALSSRKRKNLRAEREQVRRAGVTFRLVHGGEASENDLAAMHDFYVATFADKGNHPALTLDFFRHLAATMPRQLLLVLAERAGHTVAGALFLRSSSTLHGRYWGCSEALPGLHFETCYYQGIEYCLREGLAVFEPGAQGEHKIARGFLPVLTHSRHWVADPRFAAALADWCREEREWALRYRAQVLQHGPYRDPPARDSTACD